MLIVEDFEGLAPQADPARLPVSRATEARNLTMQRGALTSLPITFGRITPHQLKNESLGDFPDGHSARGVFYSHMADAWFVMGHEVTGFADSLVAPMDKWGRVYFCTPEGIRFMTSDQYQSGAVNFNRQSFRLGIPVPPAPPIANVNTEDIDEDGDPILQRVFYTYSFMDRFGHEGPLSAPSNPVDIPTDESFSVNITLPELHDSSGYALAGGISEDDTGYKLIYRSSTGSTNTVWQFVGKVPYSQTDFEDTVMFGDEAETAITEDWYPPLQTVKHMEVVANSFLAGVYDTLEQGQLTPSVVCFSMPRMLHAWPESYRFPVKYRVTAIKSSGDGLFVGTTRNPFWCFGADPQSAMPQELPYDFPCLSENSVVDMGGFVIYSSNVGLVSMNGHGGSVLTQGLFTERDWAELGPDTLECFRFEEHLMFYSHKQDELYAIHPNDPATLTTIDKDGVDLKWYLNEGKGRTVYDSRERKTILVSGQPFFAGAELLKLEKSAGATVRWVGPIVQKPPLHFSTAKVQASEYPLTFIMRGSHMEELTMEITSERPFRLPPIPPQRWVQVGVEFEADDDDRRAVYQIALARTVQELRHG